MRVDSWSVMSADRYARLSVVDVISNVTPIDLLDDVKCRGTLYDARMGPRFEKDRCLTCGGTYESCKLGHFGLIRLGTHVIMIKYYDALLSAMKAVCQVCWRTAGRECGKSEGRCVAFGNKIAPGPNGSILIGPPDTERVRWTASRVLSDFLDRVPDEEWISNPNWRSRIKPQCCIFDKVLVLSNPHRPAAVSKDGKKVVRCHRHTDAYSKLLRAVARRRPVPGVVTDEVSAAFNQLFVDARRDARSTEAETAGMLSSMTRKHGLIRNNMMGKRVDFAARAVLGGNPSLRIDEFGIPRVWRDKLTIPEPVWYGNLAVMRDTVSAGEWTSLLKSSGARYEMRDCVDLLVQLGERLQSGDTVERWLRDGDPVIAIRQPTLHRGSMMCGKVVLNDLYIVEMNVNTTTPYNGDFDGDEINVFVARSLEARVEYEELYALRFQIVNSNGSAQVYCIQNATLGLYRMTKNGERAPHLLGDLPVTSDIARDVVRRVYFENGPEAAVEVIQDMSVAATAWLDTHGASVGLNEFDCARLDSPRASDGLLLRERKKRARVVVDNLLDPRCQSRSAFGDAAAYLKDADPYDVALRDMIRSGSKGKATNELNIALVVGQQNVGDRPPPLFFGDRTLPCEIPGEVGRRGFVPVGYMQGLRPQDTAVSQMSGRFDIYTKSVGVKESGERFRSLGQCLENLVAKTGGMICDGEGDVVQFRFGSDGFDPQMVRRETGLPVGVLDSYAGVDVVDVPVGLRNHFYFKGITRIPMKVLKDWDAGTVPYGQPVGIVTAHSISEPATQETMNKFHHADDDTGKYTNVNRLFHAYEGETYLRPIKRVPPMLVSWDKWKTCPPREVWGERFERFCGIFPTNAPAYLVLRFHHGLDVFELARFKGFVIRASHPMLDAGDVIVHVALPDVDASICGVLHRFRDFATPDFHKCKGGNCNCDCYVTNVSVSGSEMRCVTKRFDRVWAADFVDARTSYTDDSRAMTRVLGIEAARGMLYREFSRAFEGKVDSRYVSLLVDAMTYPGSIRAMDYFGFRQTYGDSVLGMACFRQPLVGFFNAAMRGKKEGTPNNMSSSVITGNMCALGTGTVHVLNAPIESSIISSPHYPSGSYSPSQPYSPAYVPSSPDYIPSSPAYVPSSPDYVPSSYVPSSPGYDPTLKRSKMSD